MANGGLFDTDLGERSLDELGNLNNFFTRNVEGEVAAERAKGGRGVSEFAQEQSRKQVAVNEEIQDRLFGIHQERSMLAQETDEQRTAPVPDSPETWANDPSQWDWPGIDLPRR